MDAGRELDALVAEKVMGWKLFAGEPGYGRPPEKWSKPSLVLDEIPRYSTDIAAAWQVVEVLYSHGFDVTVNTLQDWTEKCECIVSNLGTGNDRDDGENYKSASAPTAPLAICLAALKAVGALE